MLSYLSSVRQELPWRGGLECSRTCRPGRRALAVCAAQRCFYHILGLPRNATKSDIKQAYRRLARIYHPDVNTVSMSPEHFQAIAQAYEVLSDDARRLAYDSYGHSGGGREPAGEAQGRGEQEGMPGGDVHTVVGISLREAALGAERELLVTVLAGCADCNGSGAARGSHASACELCRGTGEILKSRRVNSYGMRLSTLSSCPACGGRGLRVSEACPGCAGHGVRRQRRSLRVRIPPGVDEGSVLRLRGCGDLGRSGGPAGDVHVRFQVQAHSSMQRKGVDIHSRLALPLWDAILGGSATVETLRGQATIQVPAGTQHGATISLPRQGLPRLGGPAAAAGAHHFKVCITLPQPEEMGEGGRELLAQLARLKHAQQAQQPGAAGSGAAGAAAGGAQPAGSGIGGQPLQGAASHPQRAQRSGSAAQGRQSPLPWEQPAPPQEPGDVVGQQEQQQQTQAHEQQQRQTQATMQQQRRRTPGRPNGTQRAQQGWGAVAAQQPPRRRAGSRTGRVAGMFQPKAAAVESLMGYELYDTEALINLITELQEALGPLGEGEDE